MRFVVLHFVSLSNDLPCAKWKRLQSRAQYQEFSGAHEEAFGWMRPVYAFQDSYLNTNILLLELHLLESQNLWCRSVPTDSHSLTFLRQHPSGKVAVEFRTGVPGMSDWMCSVKQPPCLQLELSSSQQPLLCPDAGTYADPPQVETILLACLPSRSHAPVSGLLPMVPSSWHFHFPPLATHCVYFQGAAHLFPPNPKPVPGAPPA